MGNTICTISRHCVDHTVLSWPYSIKWLSRMTDYFVFGLHLYALIRPTYTADAINLFLYECVPILGGVSHKGRVIELTLSSTIGDAIRTRYCIVVTVV